MLTCYQLPTSVTRCLSGFSLFFSCVGGNQLLGGRCAQRDSAWCRIGNPLGLAGNCAERVCTECYENRDCWLRGNGYCDFGQCYTRSSSSSRG